MWDWLLNNKEWVFSGVGVAIVVALFGLVRGRLRSRQPTEGSHQAGLFSNPNRPPPSDLEICSQWFELSLSQQIPQVEVWVYIVNHLPKSIRLQAFQVNQFHISAAPALEAIPLPEQPMLPPRHTASVQCRRPLADAEARAFSSLDGSKPLNARISVSLRATSGRRTIEMTNVQLTMTGWILGSPNPPAS